MWNLWWAVELDRLSSEIFGVSLLIPLHRGCPYSYIILVMNNRPVCGQSPDTSSQHIDMNDNLSFELINSRTTLLSVVGFIFVTTEQNLLPSENPQSFTDWAIVFNENDHSI
jgi:hypothetical protein